MNSHHTVNLDQEETSLSLAPDMVRVEVAYAAAMLPRPGTCSLVGHVVAIGEVTTEFAVGDPVVALGPLKPSLMLPADSCQKIVTTHVLTENMAFWAFALSLIPLIHVSELEIGEQVLVLSNNLVGQMLMNLVWLAGAGSCIGVDPAYSGVTDQSVYGEPSRNPQRIDSLSALETILPDLSIDLLIDATGDSVNLEPNLTKVRSLGRVLTIGPNYPPRFDLNMYPDLHKRSLRMLNYRLPLSLRELKRDQGRNFPQLDQTLDYVRYLFETERLSPSNWPLIHVKQLGRKMDLQTREAVEDGTLLVEW